MEECVCYQPYVSIIEEPDHAHSKWRTSLRISGIAKNPNENTDNDILELAIDIQENDTACSLHVGDKLRLRVEKMLTSGFI